MTADDDLKTCGGRINIERSDVVNHADLHRTSLEDADLRNAHRPCVAVVVAANGRHGSNTGKCFEDARIADVARMDNEIAAAQRCQCFRPHQTMGVRHDAYTQVRGEHAQRYLTRGYAKEPDRPELLGTCEWSQRLQRPMTRS